MNQQTVQQLNQINSNFYQKIEREFDQTRQQPWEGWKTLLQFFPERKELSVLDLGCGNGRFLQFLQENASDRTVTYLGVDNNQYLLHQAKRFSNSSNTFIQTDIIESKLGFLKEKMFDVIVLFGVMHHIPSFEVRKNLLEKASEHLNADGVLIFSAWQFLSIPALQQRIIQWEMFPQIEGDQLEENDFLIDWQRGTNAYRYCHFIDQIEVDHLTQSLQLMKVDQFYADGKNSKSNLYVVLKKQTV